MENIIFEVLAYFGFLFGLIGGIYQIRASRIYRGDPLTKSNLVMVGIADLLASIMFLLAVVHYDGFANISPFSKYMRSIILMLIAFPTMVSYRMMGGNNEPK